MTGPSPGSIGEATALAIARQRPALLILASRTPAKLDAVAAGCRAAAGNSVRVVLYLLISFSPLRLYGHEATCMSSWFLTIDCMTGPGR